MNRMPKRNKFFFESDKSEEKKGGNDCVRGILAL